MNTNITFLKYFHDLAETGSVQASSNLNFVSQPAISQGIRKLEEQLQIELLFHKQRGIELTPQGKKVYLESKKIFDVVDEFESQIDQMKGVISGVLNIGISQSLASHFLTPIISDFSKKYPNIELSISFGKTNHLKKLLTDKKIEFAITIDNGELKKFKKEVIHKGKFVLFGKKNLNQLLLTEERPETNDLKKYLKSTIQNYKILELESWSIIKDFADSNIGWGLMPDFMIDKKKKTYDRTPDSYKHSYEVVVFSRKKELSLAAKKFKDFL